MLHSKQIEKIQFKHRHFAYIAFYFMEYILYTSQCRSQCVKTFDQMREKNGGGAIVRSCPRSLH